MNCSPCGSSSNYTSISTTNCVTLCGAGISTFITNPVFNLSSLNISTFTVNILIPSSISTFVNISSVSISFQGNVSTYITNPYINVNIPSTISTYVTNPSFVVNIPSTISTYVTNPYINVNIPSTISTFITNPCFTLCGAGISTFVTNFPSSFSTTIAGGSVSINGFVSTNNVNPNLDVFGQILIDTPTTTFTNHHAFTPTFESVGYLSTGTGTVFVDISNTLVQLSASGSGGRAVEQSLEYQLYQPGKGHVINVTLSPQYTGTFDNSVAVRAGIYDDYRDKNTPAGTTGPPPYLYQSSIYGGTGVEYDQPSMGHFFELSGNQWFVVERYNSPDNITNVTRVAQANWNSDTVNGNPATSKSGYVLSATTPLILFFIERQWLGVGIVRMGLYNKGTPVYCHVFADRSIRRPYTHLNKLPIRYEIEKIAGGSANSASMAAICASSQIGGDYVTLGAIFSLPSNITLLPVDIGAKDTLRPLLLLRLQQKYCRATWKLLDVELYLAAAGFYSVFRNATISGSITWTPHPDSRSMMEYAYLENASGSTRTVSGGLCIRSGFASTRTSLQDALASSELVTRTQFSSDIAGNPDVLVIAAGSWTANTDAYANARWIEIV